MESKVGGIALERAGRASRCFLHGTGGSRMHWKPVVGPLSSQREVIVVDLPGHGASDPPPAGVPHTPIGYAEVLGAMLDELGLDPAHVAGNSVGGWTALELAKNGRARSVVAIGPAGLWAKRDPWRCVFALWSQTSWAGPSRRSRRAAAQAQRPGADHGRHGGQAEADARRGRDRDGRDLRGHALLRRAPRRDEAGAVRRRRGDRCQSPIAWGEKDRSASAKARLLDELPAAAREIELPGLRPADVGTTRRLARHDPRASATAEASMRLSRSKRVVAGAAPFALSAPAN